MRQQIAAAVMAVGLAAGVGCSHHREPTGQPVAAPADAATANQIRAAYQQTAPGTVVGLVIAVLPDASLAAVGDVPVGEFKGGDVVSFIDSNQATVAVGTVVSTTQDAVHVKYEPHGEAARPVREGDLMVRVKS